MVPVHGRMQTVGAVRKPQKALVVGSPIVSPQEINSGDKINAYTPQALFLGSATVQSVRVVGAPKGVSPTEKDVVFGTTFAGYDWLQARSRPCQHLCCAFPSSLLRMEKSKGRSWRAPCSGSGTRVHVVFEGLP